MIFGIAPCFAAKIYLAHFRWNNVPTEIQGVAQTGRNRTGTPCSVGCPTAHAPGSTTADHPRTRRPVRPPAGSVTDDADRRRRQTTDASEQNNIAPLGGLVIIYY